MNKIITINLGGIAIDIEEDAYEMLRSYLLKVKNHFRGTENGAEIVDDIESRIAEMLFEKLKDKKVSINTSDVESVIEIMGQPSDFETEDQTADYSETNTRRVKRLFRDPEDGILGGVCAGLAKYLGIEVTVMRILWIVFVLLGGSGAAVYIILWVIIPKAKTAAERLQMSGEVPNIENITNSIRDEAGQAYNSIKKKANSKEAKALRSDVESFLIKLVRFVFKIGAIALVIGLLIALIGTIVHFFAGSGFFRLNLGGEELPAQFRAAMGGSGLFWLIKGAVYAILLLPIIYLLFRLFSFLLNFPSPSSNIKRGFWGAWFMALLTGITGVVYGVTLFKDRGVTRETVQLTDLPDTIEIKANSTKEGDKIYHSYTEFDIEPTDGPAYLEIVKKSRGRNRAEAMQLASSLPDNYSLTENRITVGERVHSTEDQAHRLSEINYTLYLPQNHTVILHKNTSQILHHIENVQNIYDENMAGKTFKMESNGLNCTTCPDVKTNAMSSVNSDYRFLSLEPFQTLDISDAFSVRIIEDGTIAIEIPENPDWADHIEYEVNKNVLSIELEKEIDLLFDWPSQDLDMPIIVHTNNLKNIEGNGACKLTYIPKTNVMDLYLELNGASSLRADKLKLDNLQIEANGASRISLSGEVDLLELETAGASVIDAADLVADYLRLDVGGASTCTIHVLKEISGDVAGASKIRYKGNPKISAEMHGFINIERM